MATVKSPIATETFRFFRQLGRNNSKAWMDENRDRYEKHIVQVLRALLEALTPAVHRLYLGFDVGGRTGTNFSRINRDIRFAKDKSPYRTRMYVSFPPQGGKHRTPGELYIGLGSDTVTVGYRIYVDFEAKTSSPASRMAALPRWSVQQKKRLGRKYESYWYSIERREWTKHDGWPTTADEWKGLKAWIVRRQMTPAAATRPGFLASAVKIFRDVFPLFKFTSLPR